MNCLPLRIAMAFDYAHTADLTSGVVGIDGVQAQWSKVPLLESLARRDEWDIAEAPFGKFCALVGDGDDSLVGIPVFPSRVFRHSSIFVRTDSEASSMGDLAGSRIGIPDWTQTAAIYVRGMLQHDYDVDLMGIEWIQGGLDQPGRDEHMLWPKPFRTRIEADQSLTQLLLSRELDAVVAARPPIPFWSGGGVRRLLSDPIADEKQYFRESGIFPIMHILVGRRELFVQNAWLSPSLVAAFAAARDACMERLRTPGVSLVPLPWITNLARDLLDSLGKDPWPYGVAPNMPTLRAFATYAGEQLVSARPVSVDELFPV